MNNLETTIENLKKNIINVYKPLVLVIDYNIYDNNYKILGLFYIATENKYGIINYTVKEPLFGIPHLKNIEQNLKFVNSIENINSNQFKKIIIKKTFLKKMEDLCYETKN